MNESGALLDGVHISVLCIFCADYVKEGLVILNQFHNRNGPSVLACEPCLENMVPLRGRV